MKKYTLLLISIFFFAISTMAQIPNVTKPMFSDTLLFEDWSSGSFATNQWQIDSSGLLSWRITTFTGNPAPSAIIDQTSILNANLSMTSNQIQGTNNYTELRYEIYFSDSSNSIGEFATEIYDGNVWRSIDVIDCIGSFPWTTRIVNISDFCQNSFKIRFRFYCDSFISDKLNIDNIIIGSFPLGIAEHQNADFIIKPNPAKSNFDLVLKNFENQNTRIVISDLTGKTIYTEGFVPRAKESTIRVNTENFPRGIYFCKIQSEKTTLIRKLILD